MTNQRPGSVGPLRRAVDATAAGELASAVMGARVHVSITVPRTEVRGEMRLLTRGENREVRAAARRALTNLGMPATGLDLTQDWLEEVATRSIAIAVRQPGNHALALAPLEDWEECEDDQIADLWRQYADLEEQLDPLAVGCTPAEAQLIIAAAKKKDRVLLRSYGSRRLAHYITTLDDQPPS